MACILILSLVVAYNNDDDAMHRTVEYCKRCLLCMTRPAKLPLFHHANGSIRLPDDAVTTANRDSSNVEVTSGFSLHQNSSYVSHHPKPAAVSLPAY